MSSSLPTTDVPVKEIFGDPSFNCRGHISSHDVRELIKSVEVNGLQQPIVIQPYDLHPPHKYRVVMGHRRLRAFEALKRETIPAIIRTDLKDEAQALAMNLIENLERKELTIMQEAKAIERFLHAGVPRENVAKLIGMSSGWVQTRFTALKLPPEIQSEIDAGYVTATQIKDLYSIPSNDERFRLVREIKDARIRGEKIVIKEKSKKPKKSEKRPRTVQEIFALQDAIQAVVGNNFGTRCLAWSSGMISDRDIYEDLKNLADEQGIPYSVPLEFAT